jgi:hypothetical protein
MTTEYAMRRSLGLVAGLAAGLLAVCSGCSAPIAAQDQLSRPKVGELVPESFKVAPADGEFRRGTAPGLQGIACVQSAKHSAAPDFSLDPCLRLGPLKSGMQFGELQKALLSLNGIPERAVNDPRLVNTSSDGTRTLMLPLATAEQGGKVGLLSYLVVIVDKADFVQTLQLTGRSSAATAQLPFSSVRIGTPQDRVIDLLGLPSSVTDVPQTRGKNWSYEPFSFSIEFVSGLVYSVRLERPRAGNGRPFVPLKSLPQ